MEGPALVLSVCVSVPIDGFLFLLVRGGEFFHYSFRLCFFFLTSFPSIRDSHFFSSMLCFLFSRSPSVFFFLAFHPRLYFSFFYACLFILSFALFSPLLFSDLYILSSVTMFLVRFFLFFFYRIH